jgi:hypothetical protein
MNEDEYLKNRVDNQIIWFDRKSIKNKKWFTRLKLIETVLALIIPFLTGFFTSEAYFLKISVGLFGVIISACLSINSLYKLQDNWIHYRTINELLKQEKYLFITKSGPYKEDNAFTIFAERIESIMNRDNADWLAYTKSQKEKN